MGSMTLSMTVRHLSRTGFWNTMPTSERGPTTSFPRTLTEPDDACTSPAMIFRIVVFPHPLWPTMVKNSPSATRKETSASAWTGLSRVG